MSLIQKGEQNIKNQQQYATAVAKIIISETSPSKVINCKIDEVPSPVGRKHRMPIHSCQWSDSVKKRKYKRKRLSESGKLDISLTRVDKNQTKPKLKDKVSSSYEEEKIYDNQDDMGLKELNEISQTQIKIANTMNNDNNQLPKDCNQSSTNENIIFNKKLLISNEVDCTPLNSLTSGDNDLNISISRNIRSDTIQIANSPCKKIQDEISMFSVSSSSNISDSKPSSNLFFEFEEFDGSPCETLEMDGSRCTKKKKKHPAGSLAERCSIVSTRVDNNMVLFSYELKAGLRKNSSQNTSVDLIVNSIFHQPDYEILCCKSTSHLVNTHSEKCKILNYRIFVISNNSSSKIGAKDVINVHFPCTVVMEPQLPAFFIYAGNCITLGSQATSNFKDDVISYKKSISYDELFSCKFSDLRLEKKIHVICSNQIGNCILESIVAQPLVSCITLELFFLYFYKLSDSYSYETLMCDKENQYLRLVFNINNVKISDLNIETLIGMEGSKIRISGIRFTDYTFFDSSLEELIKYVHVLNVNTRIIYEAHTIDSDFKIINLQRSLWPKICSSMLFILTECMDYKRYCIQVESILSSNNGFLICDKSVPNGLLLKNCSHLALSNENTPFMIDAVFYLKGELNADKYSKIKRIHQ